MSLENDILPKLYIILLKKSFCTQTLLQIFIFYPNYNIFPEIPLGYDRQNKKSLGYKV